MSAAHTDLHNRNTYRWFKAITTRWLDNDVYGHINNVNYYAFFDTVANSYLIEHAGLDIQNSQQIGYIVHSECHYREAIAFPESIEGGLRVDKLGTSSVQYGIAIFKRGADRPSAHGTFTHVFVDRQTERPLSIKETLRTALESIQVHNSSVI